MTSAPEDVGRHQVGRELNAVEPQVDRLGQLLDQQRLRQARHAAQQAVAAGEKRDQDLADDALLPDDGLGQLALEPPGHLRDALEGNRRCRDSARLKVRSAMMCWCTGSVLRLDAAWIVARGSMLAEVQVTSVSQCHDVEPPSHEPRTSSRRLTPLAAEE